MTSKTKLICALDLLFLFLLLLSGATDGAIGDVIYYLAFLVPILIGFYFICAPEDKNEATENTLKAALSDFKISKRGAILSLPIVFPAISVILLLSYLTSLVLGIFGYENDVAFDMPFLSAVISHALVPAVLEELLFRFVPIKLLKEERKSALVLSSLMFAFAHANLFQIPYALAAGIIFAFLYIMTGSILSSILLHFLNNLISLISIYTEKDGIIISAVTVGALISFAVIFALCKSYSGVIKDLIGDGKVKIERIAFVFIGVSAFLAITSLIFG